MQSNTPSNNTSNKSIEYPTIGFMEERRIKSQVDAITADTNCIVTDIAPNAHCIEREYSGKYLKEHCNEILGVLRHGFIVKKHGENGKDTVIFVYMGPIPHVVEKILHTTIH